MPWTEQPPALLVVVEDSDEDFDTVVEAVKRSRVTAEVRRATTGEAGMTLLREVTPERPVIVLMDLNTPGTDGREALAAIKTDPALKSTPVIVFSTSSNPKDIGFCYAAGANAYHVKPVRYPDHLQLVIDLVGYWLGRVALTAVGGSNS
jgi:CheY-like chemotaxis protein